MITSLVYNIPAAMVNAYRGQDIIVRSRDPSEILQQLDQYDLNKIAYMQILGTGGAIDGLMRWEHAVPVDLVIQNPQAELPMLYRYRPLLSVRPVRVSVRVAAGFSNVVKLALSLDFSVKLELFQPEPELTEELLQVAALYLHQSTVSQPVEFIHSVFWSFYHEKPVTLWAVQEDDPAAVRYVTDTGAETLSPRFAAEALKYDVSSFVKDFSKELLVEKQACGCCAFFETCAGYFKWPRREYRCDGVKSLLQMLRATAAELKADLSACSTPGKENGS